MGFPWRKFATIAKVIAPVVLSTIPSVPPVLGPLVSHAIMEAEGVPGATGADKKAHVLAILNDALVTAAALGKPIGNPVVIVPAVSQGVDAVITTIKAIQLAHPPEAPA
jgi:hypothetical protein